MTHIPSVKKLPQAYLNWLYKEANKDSYREWAQREETSELPKYQKIKIPFTGATAYNFGRNIIKSILV